MFKKAGGPNHMPPQSHPPKDQTNRSALIGPGEAKAINAAGLDRLRSAAKQVLVNALANHRSRRAPNDRHRKPCHGAANRSTKGHAGRRKYQSCHDIYLSNGN
jgi:hypothetical protein